MGKPNVADTIREITHQHLTKNNGLLLGQCISAVGWVNDTVPSNGQNIIELPMTDVAGAGIAVGTAIVGRRPIFIMRFQDFLFLNSSPIINYAGKAKEIFGRGVPIFVRAIATEGHGIGILHSACLHSMFMHVPGIQVCCPMTPEEYKDVWSTFMSHDEPMLVSEHRCCFGETEEMQDIIMDNADITIFAISAARFSAIEAVKILKEENIKCNLVHIVWLKPFCMLNRFISPLQNSRLGLVVDSDYEIAGASQAVACELMKATSLPVEALGRRDKSVGVGQHLENATPTATRIAERVREMVRRVN